jgi:hypothetical protein
MRYAILLLATLCSTVTAGSERNADLQQPKGRTGTFPVAAVCESSGIDSNRFGAATLDILPCDRPTIDLAIA